MPTQNRLVGTHISYLHIFVTFSVYVVYVNLHYLHIILIIPLIIPGIRSAIKIPKIVLA